MPAKRLDFSKHNLVFDLNEVKRMFSMHTQDCCRHMVKRLLEESMLCDLQHHLQAQWNQRTESRSGYRNGYRERTLLTGFGSLELQVPRDRAGQYKPGCFERYKRVERTVDEGIRSMFIRGVSTHKVGEVLDALFGFKVSASYVSSVTRELDSLVREFENSAIDDDYAFLFIDGIYVRVRYELQEKRMVLLVAYGIRRDGSRKILSFRLAKRESRASYQSFLENLKTRGLKGHKLDLIIMDGSPGLWSAVDEVYADIPHQLCWVHKLRNIGGYCAKRYRKQCVGEAAQIMYAKTPRKAANRFRKWRDKWQSKTPRAVRCLEKDFDKLIPFLEFDPEFHKVIRTTNIIERCFREVRRRLKVMGSFQNSKSCRRIVASLFEYFNIKWTAKINHIKSITKYYQEAA
ncbi:MAG: IS256 family transposase [Candidatus Zixiibacteriota bacterium]|nr:MAG: IS256 family transposase [candidate division Zixibacteria bacterium]